MAHPVSLQLPSRDARETLSARLHSAPADHAEALLAAYAVLQGLHDRGVLELARGVLGPSERVLEIAVDAMHSEASIRGIRNVVTLLKLLGTIEPQFVEAFSRSVSEAVALGKTYDSESPGFWTTELHDLRSRDLRRGLVFLSGLLEAFGQGLAQIRSTPDETSHRADEIS